MNYLMSYILKFVFNYLLRRLLNFLLFKAELLIIKPRPRPTRRIATSPTL